MEILYISTMVDDGNYKKIFTQKVKPMYAANKYHSLLVKGLIENKMKVNAYTYLPINSKNCSKKIIKVKKIEKQNLKINYISTINLPIIRNLIVFFKSLFKAVFLKKDTVIIYDTLVVSASLGAMLAAKIFGRKSIAIVTDLPEFMPISKNKNSLKINNFLMNSADGYIFLTEQMNDKINRNKKPYIIIEGLVDEKMKCMNHEKIDLNNYIKKIIYAGSLQRIYGIENLCKSFLKYNDENSELHIYGDGDYVNELENLVKQNNNIFYHGNVANEEVVLAELKATLLVNPRPSEGEYTKYSFPSKTLEYMVSGTPVLTSKLPGIPSEYREYLMFFENCEDGLFNSLKEILSISPYELLAFGEKAKKFALNNKGYFFQSKKVIQLIEKVKNGGE